MREELDRKTLETIERVYLDHESGKCNNAQFSYAVDILWSAYSGLAGKDFLTMIEALGGSVVRDSSFMLHEVYQDESGNVARLTNTNNGVVLIALYRQGAVRTSYKYDFQEELNPIQTAKAKFQKLGDGLLMKGFQQL